VDYYFSSIRYSDPTTSLQLTSSLHAVSAMLGATYALQLGRVRPYASLGMAVTPLFLRAQLDGQTVAQSTLVAVGGFLAPGIELPIGPGAAYLEVLLALGTRPTSSQFSVDGSGLFLALGYRFSVLTLTKPVLRPTVGK
jgi:hypothetical protein